MSYIVKRNDGKYLFDDPQLRWMSWNNYQKNAYRFDSLQEAREKAKDAGPSAQVFRLTNTAQLHAELAELHAELADLKEKVKMARAEGARKAWHILRNPMSVDFDDKLASYYNEFGENAP